MAFDNFELLAAAKERVQEKKYAGKQAREWKNPSLGADLGMAKVGKDGGIVYGASLSQELPFPGKRELRSEIARFDENLALLSHDEMKLYIYYEVRKLSYEYSIRLFAAQHLQDRLRRMRLINEHMKTHVLISPQKIVQSKIVQMKASSLEKDIMKLKTSQRLSFEKLNIYTRLPDKTLPFIEVEWYKKAPPLDLDRILERSGKNSFAVRRQMEFLKKSEKEILLAEKDAWPDFGVSVFYNGQNAGDRENIVGGGISFPLPVLTRNKNAIERFKAAARSEKLLLELSEKTVRNQITMVFNEYQYTSSILPIFPVALLEELDRNMLYADTEFIKGRIDFQTYFEMETQTHSMIETVMQIQYDIANLHSGILFLTGEDISMGKSDD